MTSPVFHKFPLIINRTLTCIHCNSSGNCERYDPGFTEDDRGFKQGHYIFCSSCDQQWPDEANKEWEALENERDYFWNEHSRVIKKALKSYTTSNSFGKNKIKYSKFIPELIEFFEDNCEALEGDSIKKLNLKFLITEDGVDLIDLYLNEIQGKPMKLP